MTSPSRLVRLAVRERFAAEFNGRLAAACAEAGIDAFEVNFADPLGEQNYYEGYISLDSLMSRREPALPAVVLWTGSAENVHEEKPRAFHGPVTLRGECHLYWPGMRTTHFADLHECFEAAVIETLDAAEFTDVGYNGDVRFDEPGELQVYMPEDEAVGWVQTISFQVVFEVRI